MTFYLNGGYVTIGPLEPAMLVALVLAMLCAVGLVMFVLPHVGVALLYPLFHPDDREAVVCVALVWPLFLAPPLLGYSVAGVVLRRSQVA